MVSYPAALHRTIMTVDVAGYNHPARTMAHLREVHEALWRVLKGGFAETGIPWDVCFVENTGDGAMILLPPDIAKVDLVAQLPERMHAELRRHNAVHSEPAQIQLRLALHAGEVQSASHGSVGKAVSFTFRVLDAAEAKKAQKLTGAELALLASDVFYQEVVLQDPAAAPAEYRRIAVTTKETSTVAWLRLLGGEPAGERRPDLRAVPSPAGSAIDRVMELTELLLGIPAVTEESSRRMLLKRLRPEIATVVAYHPQTRLHVLEIAGTCLRYRGGLAELVAAVQMLEPGSVPVRRLVERVGNWPEESPA
ncbi:adenylate/guanylate cyclase domain-containing protein [Amycolatopsis sp. MtRt-6]|uniref:adenylate/guanylate cyclase domain-containing protein n=1 Tax=Amycolatopsis sp. MtRt-6 TaxID=2792782 RepID=UPI001A8C3A72|nr:adenylate/guanylate cyclase domain-containing protein [Amycolatopsis sp. MtRt-6]